MSSVSIPVLPLPGRRPSPEFDRAMVQARGEIATWKIKYPAPDKAEAHWYIAIFRPGGNQLRVQASYEFDADSLRNEAEFLATYAEEAEVLEACEHLADMKLTAGGKNILGGR